MSRPPSLLHPRYWWVWLFAVPFTWLAAWLPWPVQHAVGNLLGDLTWLVAAGRRRVTLTNLRLCFPERDEAWRRQVARESFRNAAISLFESGWAWWRPVPVLARRLRVEGVENLRAAQAQGRGILILGAHFTTLEFIGAAATPTVVVDTVYRPQNNAALEALVHARRSRYYGRQIDRRDVRGVFRALKENRAVWYTGDQDFGMRQAVFAPFFGVPAATVTAATRFARHNDSVAVPVNFRREPDGNYVLCFEPPIIGFGADEAADAAAMNRHIEQGILKAPGQYMWFHRRFKSTPPGEASRYARPAH